VGHTPPARRSVLRLRLWRADQVESSAPVSNQRHSPLHPGSPPEPATDSPCSRPREEPAAHRRRVQEAQDLREPLPSAGEPRRLPFPEALGSVTSAAAADLHARRREQAPDGTAEVAARGAMKILRRQTTLLEMRPSSRRSKEMRSPTVNTGRAWSSCRRLSRPTV
jgi:hypothetical protein